METACAAPPRLQLENSLPVPRTPIPLGRATPALGTMLSATPSGLVVGEVLRPNPSQSLLHVAVTQARAITSPEALEPKLARRHRLKARHLISLDTGLALKTLSRIKSSSALSSSSPLDFLTYSILWVRVPFGSRLSLSTYCLPLFGRFLL